MYIIVYTHTVCLANLNMIMQSHLFSRENQHCSDRTARLHLPADADCQRNAQNGYNPRHRYKMHYILFVRGSLLI